MRDLLRPALRWMAITAVAAYILWPEPAGTATVSPPADATPASEALDDLAAASEAAAGRWGQLAQVAADRQAVIAAGEACGLSQRTAVAVYGAEREFDLPRGLLLAVIELESDCNEAQVTFNSRSVDIGVAQLNYTFDGRNSTGPWLAGLTGANPLDPAENVRISAYYLRYHYDRHGSWQAALDAYNTGRPHETDYSRAVLARWGGD